MSLNLSISRLGLSGGRGGDTTPAVLTLVSDDLDQDPPVYSFDSTKAGTLRWDFHSSATPPAAGAGDIATGTQAAVAGQNDIELDLSAYENETGYLHFRINASNILTSQQITVPLDYADFIVATTSNTFSSGASRSETGLSPLELGYFGGLTVTADSTGDWRAIGLIESPPIITSIGVPINISVLIKAGTSGNARINARVNTVGDSSITGTLGSLAVTSSAGGTISNLAQTDLGSSNWRIDFTFSPSGANDFVLYVGPFTNTTGQTVIFLGAKIT